jgi:hypothetical protein
MKPSLIDQKNLCRDHWSQQNNSWSKRCTNTKIDEGIIWLNSESLQVLPERPLRLTYHGKLMPRDHHCSCAVGELCAHLQHELVVLWYTGLWPASSNKSCYESHFVTNHITPTETSHHFVPKTTHVQTKPMVHPGFRFFINQSLRNKCGLNGSTEDLQFNSLRCTLSKTEKVKDSRTIEEWCTEKQLDSSNSTYCSCMVAVVPCIGHSHTHILHPLSCMQSLTPQSTTHSQSSLKNKIEAIDRLTT